MPTPFYHLSVAEELLQHPGLPPEAGARLKSQRGAFLFGNTAPDVQGFSHQKRADTHFFDLPLRSIAHLPWEQMLLEHPSLAQMGDLDTAQAAFVTGYLCHLQADWLWVKEIFVPVFGLRSSWGSFPHRLYLHNVLRAYLDRQILPGLRDGVCASLSEAVPNHWLPFVADEHLRQWRDYLVEQLLPGTPTQTVEVFAARQGIPVDAYTRLLNSEEAMEREIFTRIDRTAILNYRQRLVEENLQLVEKVALWDLPGSR